MSISTYFGLADSLGIESIFCLQDFVHKLMVERLKGNSEAVDESKSMKSILRIRAEANRQRFATVYQVDLEKDEAKEIEELIKTDPKVALARLKSLGKDIKLMSIGGVDNEKLWKKIPISAEDDPYQ
jgi:hypothetical protein